MRIYVLDDEPIALRGSVKIIQETAPQAQIRGFGRAKAAFKHIKESGEYPDVVFSDIEMPGMSGLDFAVRLKKQCPDTILIFVTAYSQYALEAFRLHVHGYILKPLTEARVREELDYALIRIGKRRSAKLPQGQHQTREAGADAGAASDKGDQSNGGYKSGERSGSGLDTCIEVIPSIMLSVDGHVGHGLEFQRGDVLCLIELLPDGGVGCADDRSDRCGVYAVLYVMLLQHECCGDHHRTDLVQCDVKVPHLIVELHDD